MGSSTLLVLHATPFGHEFAEHTEQELGDTFDVRLLGVDDGTHPAFWPTADVVVMATSHPRPQLTEMIDTAAFAWHLPWVQVELEPTSLRCGPTVVPGRTACHRCFRRREQQHGRGDRDAASADAVTGHAPFHVAAALALCHQALQEALRPAPPHAVGGTVRTLDLIEGETARNPVVAVDRCPRCRPAPREVDTRLFTTLHARLNALAG